MPRKTTRNAQGGGSIRKRKDGLWEGRFTFGHDPGTGKQIQKSVYGKTQAEVRKKLQQATVDVDEGVYIEPIKMTFGNWCDIWLKEYTVGVKQSTESVYAQLIRARIKPALGSVKLSELNALQIQTFYNVLQRGTAEERPLSPKTIKNVHCVVHKALEQARILSYVRSNPASGCILPRAEKPEIKPLDDIELSTFLKAIKGSQFEVLFTVDLFTGMRQSELIGLTWDCINFERGTIFVNKQLVRERKKNSSFFFSSLKNDKTRSITPASSVMQILKKHKITQAKMKLAAGNDWNDGGFKDLVFTNELGGHLTHNTVARNFKRILNKAGIDDRRFHDLRHSYAVAALRCGDDIKTVQENLGHHTAAFTLDQYGHVTEAMKRESSQRMENFINSIEH